MCFIMGYYKYVVKLLIKNIMGKLITFILGWFFMILLAVIILIKNIIMWDWDYNLSVGDLFTQEAYDIMFLIKKINIFQLK